VIILSLTRETSSFRADLLNPQLTGNMLSATKCYVARGEILNEKTPFNAFSGKAETERLSNFENL
jgi:hypothetical protein